MCVCVVCECVCVYVCMYVCMYVCACVCVFSVGFVFRASQVCSFPSLLKPLTKYFRNLIKNLAGPLKEFWKVLA